MIPGLPGRYQTRIFLVVVIGSLWTLIIAPFLPDNPNYPKQNFTDMYPATFLTLAIVLVLGLILWEWFWFILQLCRWEKDWPAMFFMLELIPEAILAWYVFKWIGPSSDVATLSTYLWHIIPTWIIMWLFVLGPIKVLFIRWRFNGGRIFF